MKTETIEIKDLDNCCTDLETLLVLDKRAVEDLENNTHNIGQEEVLTIIREFIRCKNDYKYIKEKYVPKYKIKEKKDFIKSLNEKIYYEENVIGILQELLD